MLEKLESVDLRYDRQIIVNPDLRGAPRPEALSPSAAKAAMNAGVKRAALVNYERFASHPVSSASKGQTKTDRSLIAKVQIAQIPQIPQTPDPKPSLQNSAVVKTKPASSPAPKAVAKKHANSSVTKKSSKKAHKKSVAKAPAKKPAVSAAPATVQGKSIPSQASPGSSKKKPSAAIEKDQGHS